MNLDTNKRKWTIFSDKNMETSNDFYHDVLQRLQHLENLWKEMMLIHYLKEDLTDSTLVYNELSRQFMYRLTELSSFIGSTDLNYN